MQGVGKRDLALHFAQALNCEVHGRRGSTCEEADAENIRKCRACSLIPGLTYPDLHLVEPEDSGGVIKVDQVRELQQKLALAPYEGTYRIAILDQFHQATPSASNALLKILEEPPSQVILLLTAFTAEHLLPTIVSRCEVLPLRAVPLEILEAQLKKFDDDPENIRLASRLSFGMPGLAAEIIQNPDFLELRQQRLQELIRLMSETRAERFRFAAQHTRGRDYRKQRKLLMEILKTWLSFLRDVLLQALEVDFRMRNPDWVDEINMMASSLNPKSLLAVVLAIDRTLHALDQNANIQLSFENLMLDLPYLASRSG
jgi:DNA polymerase-3 subunit delta'